MPTSLIDHLVWSGSVVAYDRTARLPLTPRVDPTVYGRSELQRRSGAILAAATTATVLIADEDVTFALEPWANWQFEHGVLAWMGRVAQHHGVSAGDAAGDLPYLDDPGEAVHLAATLTAGTLAPLQPLCEDELHAGGGDHPLLRVTASVFQQRYRDVLNRAATEPVLISRHNDPIGVLEPFATRLRDSEFVRHIRDAMLFLTAYRMADGPGDGDHPWVVTSPYPWLAPLPRQDLGDFAAALMPTLLRSLREADPDIYSMNLRAWQSACETRGDERFEEALLMPIDQALQGSVELEPPSEQELAAADETAEYA